MHVNAHIKGTFYFRYFWSCGRNMLTDHSYKMKFCIYNACTGCTLCLKLPFYSLPCLKLSVVTKISHVGVSVAADVNELPVLQCSGSQGLSILVPSLGLQAKLHKNNSHTMTAPETTLLICALKSQGAFQALVSTISLSLSPLAISLSLSVCRSSLGRSSTLSLCASLYPITYHPLPLFTVFCALSL